MEYKILIGSLESLEQQVNAHLQDDWQLQGGVCLTFPESIGGREFSQAMVRPRLTGLLQGFQMVPEREALVHN